MLILNRSSMSLQTWQKAYIFMKIFFIWCHSSLKSCVLIYIYTAILCQQICIYCKCGNNSILHPFIKHIYLIINTLMSLNTPTDNIIFLWRYDMSNCTKVLFMLLSHYNVVIRKLLLYIITKQRKKYFAFVQMLIIWGIP